MNDTYKAIENYYKKNLKLIKEGKLIDQKDASISAAAAYLVDLIETLDEVEGITAKEKQEIKSLQNPISKAVMKVAMFRYFSVITSGKDIEFCIQDLSKLLGSYELFTLYYSFKALGDSLEDKVDVEIKVDNCILPKTQLFNSVLLDNAPKIVFETKGKQTTFDVYGKMYNSLKKDSKFGNIAMLGIPSFHTAVRDEIVKGVFELKG